MVSKRRAKTRRSERVKECMLVYSRMIDDTEGMDGVKWDWGMECHGIVVRVPPST